MWFRWKYSGYNPYWAELTFCGVYRLLGILTSCWCQIVTHIIDWLQFDPDWREFEAFECSGTAEREATAERAELA